MVEKKSSQEVCIAVPESGTDRERGEHT